jgi:hypothetical protein
MLLCPGSLAPVPAGLQFSDTGLGPCELEETSHVSSALPKLLYQLGFRATCDRGLTTTQAAFLWTVFHHAVPKTVLQRGS